LGIPFVFDMRGLYAEERVEAGIWRPNGLIFRITKWMEKGFLRDAASIITLTHASAPSLWRRIAANGGNGGLHVIPTTVDLELFQPLPLARNVGFTLAYVGSVGSWYMLDEMLSFGSVVLQEVPGSRLLYVVNEEAAAVLRAAQQAGVEESRCTVRSVAHSDVPNALKDVNATICFCTPSGSKIASAPVKVGESLAMGIPVIVNRGVGDSATLVSATGVGAVADPLDKSTFGPAIRAILSLTMDPDLSMKCRQVAEANFSVDRAAAQYSDIYKEIGR
jgi:glycosyltransferase involved in cell wall biosynthesis